MTAQNSPAHAARVRRLKNGKTLRNNFGFARFVIGGRFEVTPYTGKRTYHADADTCVTALDTLVTR